MGWALFQCESERECVHVCVCVCVFVDGSRNTWEWKEGIMMGLTMTSLPREHPALERQGGA